MNAALLWPAAGLALLVLLRKGLRWLPAVLAGTAVLAFAGTTALVPSLILSVTITAETGAAAWVLERFGGYHGRLSRVREVVALIGFGALTTAAGALVATAALVLASDATWSLWLDRWLADLTSILILLPLLVEAPAIFLRFRPRPASALVLVAGVVIVTLVVFGPPSELSRPYIFYAVLTWAALSFEMPGAIVSIFLVALFATVGTATGMGPFEGALSLHVFMTITAATFLVAGGAMAEWRHTADALSEAIRTRDGFLVMAAHELRTPLAVLRLKTDVLQLKTQKEGTLQRLGVDVLSRQVSRLIKLTENLFDTARLLSGKLQLQTDLVDLTAVVNDVVSAAKRDGTPNLPPITVEGDARVMGNWDRMRLEQIVGNLVHNAQKYGEGKPVTITVECDPRFARLRVNDQGLGIAPKNQERIFERFAQVIASGESRSGLGLGLWIAQQFATAMSGSIRVDSAPGEGSTFVVELPRGDLSSMQAAKAPSKVREGSDVLLIEDDDDARELFADILRSEGINVTAVGSGEAALDNLRRSGRPRLILLDLMMPGMDGKQFLDRARKRLELDEVPVLVISAHANLRLEAESMGVEGFLAKPFEADKLVSTVTRYIH